MVMKETTLSNLAKGINRIIRENPPVSLKQLADELIARDLVEDDQQFALDSEELQIWWSEIYDAVQELIEARKVGVVYTEDGHPQTLFATVVYVDKDGNRSFKYVEKKKFKFGRDLCPKKKEVQD